MARRRAAPASCREYSMLPQIVTCALALTVAGCGGQHEPIQNVTYGMTKEKVREIMGKPDRTERSAAGTECWYWGGSATRGPHSGVCYTEGEVSLIVPAPEPD